MTINARSDVDVEPASVLKLVQCNKDLYLCLYFAAHSIQSSVQGVFFLSLHLSPCLSVSLFFSLTDNVFFTPDQVAKSSGANYSVHREQARPQFNAEPVCSVYIYIYM